jgi:hypothetical protein
MVYPALRPAVNVCFAGGSRIIIGCVDAAAGPDHSTAKRTGRLAGVAMSAVY